MMIEEIIKNFSSFLCLYYLHGFPSKELKKITQGLSWVEVANCLAEA